MDADEYESLPTTKISTNMAAGAIAGVMEHCVMYPLDSVKTRMQSMSPTTAGQNILKTFQNMVKNEGIFRPIRGVTAVVAGAGPAHALYFGTYEMSKEALSKYTTLSNVNYLISGSVATVIHDAISNPADVIKQRLQMYNSPYKSVLDCMRGIYKSEGITAFYRSYSTQLMMNIPNTTIHFTTYEFFQNLLNSERRYNPPVHVVAGGAAGACAAAVTTPLDVIKTLLNTQETGLTKGMREAFKQIYSVAGPRGFFRGIAARVLYAMPATAICWSTYEFFKFYFCGIDREQYKSSVTGKKSLQPKSTSLRLSVDPGQIDLNEAPKSAYVLPNTTSSVAVTIETNKECQQPPTTSPPSTPGSIKAVCELSSSVTGPTLNLHTRHTEVKRPFDRGFSSP